MLDIKDLRRVMALAEAGSFNRAARTLNISQPALTKHVARLEDTLGVTLFHRSRRGVTPTEYGRVLIDRGKDLIREGALLERQIHLLGDLQIGALRLGVGPVIEQRLLPRVLGQFMQAFPGIGIDVTVDYAARLLLLVERGDLDMAVGAFELAPDEGSLHVEALADQELLFLTRPEHPLAALSARRQISMRDIQAYPIAAPELPLALHTWLTEPADPEGSPVGQRLVCESYAVLRAVSKLTNHITGGPGMLFEDDIKDGSLVSLDLDFSRPWEAVIVTRPEARHSKAIRAITAVFHDVADEIWPARKRTG